MLNKAFIGAVFLFWAVMMTALVCQEFFPHAQMRSVPVSEVMDKVFHAPDPANLDVVYRGMRIGSFRLDIASGVATTNLDDQARVYSLKGNLLLNLIVFGTPSRMHVRWDSLFDDHYKMKNYGLQSDIGESHTNIRGDNDDRVLDLTYGVGPDRQSRHLSYDDLGGQDVFSALGMNGVPGSPAFGTMGLLSGASSSSVAKDLLSRLDMHAYLDKLKTARGEQPAYLIEVKMDQSLNLWAKIWVDQLGGLLMVETSMGLSMHADGFGPDAQIVDRAFEREHRRRHDSN